MVSQEPTPQWTDPCIGMLKEHGRFDVTDWNNLGPIVRQNRTRDTHLFAIRPTRMSPAIGALLSFQGSLGSFNHYTYRTKPRPPISSGHEPAFSSSQASLTSIRRYAYRGESSGMSSVLGRGVPKFVWSLKGLGNPPETTRQTHMTHEKWGS